MTVQVESGEGQATLTFRVRRLDLLRTRRLVPDLERRSIEGREVRVDLRRIGFVRPFGLVFLYWYIRHLLDLGARRVLVVLDQRNEDICYYLKRMNLPEVFSEDDPVTFYPIQNLRLRRQDLANTLVELTTVQVTNGAEVEREAQRIVRVVLDKRPDLRDRYHELHLTVSELLDNVFVHSRTQTAALAVQAYQDGVYVAFGDGGRGIPSALQGHVHADSDAQYVARALEPQVTSRRDSGGMGLTMLSELVREGGGHMGIRSGTGEVLVHPARQSQYDNCLPLSGTFAEVALDR